MSTLLRSLVSAFLALLLLATLTAPLSSRVVDGEAPVVSTSDRHGAVATDFQGAGLSEETLQSDRSSAPASFIKPNLAETVVAERGFDETDTSLSDAPRLTRPSPAGRPEAETPTQEPDTRRALLRVYRL